MLIVKEIAQSFWTERLTVSNTVARQLLKGYPKGKISILLRADESNSDNDLVWIGSAGGNSDTSNSRVLHKGQEVELKLEDPDKLWIFKSNLSGSGNPKLNVLGQ